MAYLQDDIDCSCCVDDGIELLWDSVSFGITQRWLKTIDTPIAVEVCMLKMKKVVAWSVVPHDGALEEHAQLEQRYAEGEPLAASIDPWARGTVPTRKVEPDPFLSYKGSASGPPSVASRQPSVRGSDTSRTSGFSKTGGSGAGGRSPKKGDNMPGTIIELDEEHGFDFDSTNTMFNTLQKLQRQKLKELKLRESQASVDEFAVLKEQIATAQKGLRGKDKNAKFVIDKDGKLITIDPVRPEGLPPFAVPLATAIGDGNDDDDDAKRRKGKGKKSVRVVGSPSALVEGRYFTPANTLAATLAGGEKITDINPGVTIQAGDSTRAGPEAVSPPGKTSRKEYLRGGNTGSAILDASYAESPGGASPGVHFALEGESIASLGGNFDRAASPSLLSAPGTASMRMPDIDVFEGSRRVAPVDALDAEEEDVAVAEVDAGGSRSDLSLVANRLPVKPSEGVKANMAMLHGGPAIPGDRDRFPPISALPPSERTKLPAPMIGQTTGHGLPVASAGHDKTGGPSGNTASFVSTGSPLASYASGSGSKSGTRGGRENSGGVIHKDNPSLARQIR